MVKNTIKIQRAIKDLTQEDLANLIGVSRQTVNSIENNRYIPSTLLALKISKVFEKNVNDIFELEESD
ncbi:MAG: helix-turn-helix transcriptional regulator [Bacteroidales bacterium]|nr:helix-turn-helix transcriptional regulator [Bacteroidales bacterium]